ncbi:hypothetical protein [Luteibacter sp. Lutesp34]|uniref:hypothetical protein n=1 Tax=Luteibacter sp. Lutesp34 TaxID=3243030 RepID=UPI0039B43E5F
MRAILEPPPSSNWSDVFAELLETADPSVRQSHPILLGALITFFPAADVARKTATLLKSLVAETNEAYRKRGFSGPEHAHVRELRHVELEKLAASLNGEQPPDVGSLGNSPFARPHSGKES